MGETYKQFGIYFHFRERLVELHVFLANVAAIFYDLNSFLEVVRSDGTALNAGF